MATPIGVNTVTSISRRYIMKDIADNVYNDNLLFFRLCKANRKVIQGGYQIELPLMYARMASGGYYQGYDLLDVSPSDTIQNAAFDWKQLYVPVTVDGLTLLKTDSPEAIANYLTFYFNQAEMEMAEQLGTGLWSDGVTNVKSLDGLFGAIDNGAVRATYGGITRASAPWWNAQIDSATTTLTLLAIRTLFGNATQGGRHPTIIISGQTNYNRYWNLVAGATGGQRFPVQPAGRDEQLAQAGFDNMLFDGTPWAVDAHCPNTTGNNGVIFLLNEDYLYFVVAPRADFTLEDFQTPVNQDAMSAKLLWAGNIVINNVQRQAKFLNVAA